MKPLLWSLYHVKYKNIKLSYRDVSINLMRIMIYIVLHYCIASKYAKWTDMCRCTVINATIKIIVQKYNPILFKFNFWWALSNKVNTILLNLYPKIIWLAAQSRLQKLTKYLETRFLERDVAKYLNINNMTFKKLFK